MKNLLRLFSLLATCWTVNAHAQVNAVILGPSEMCIGECAIFEVVIPDSSIFIETATWTSSGGTVISSQTIVSVCADDPNGLFLTVSGFAFGINGQTYDYLGQLIVEVTTAVNPIIISTSATCPDSLAACDKVCAFNTAVYEATNIPPGLDIEWIVEGAENYTPDGSEVIVEWGAPGQGEVTAIVGGNAGVEPLQIFCGLSNLVQDPATDEYIGTSFLRVYGGTPPFQYTLTGPNGISTSGNISGSSIFHSNLEEGVYVYTVTSGDGQSTDCSFIVGNDPCWLDVYPAEFSQPTSCDSCDSFIELGVYGGPQATFTFQWSNGNTTMNQFGLCPGNYSVTVTDGTNCIDVIDFIIYCPQDVCQGESTLCVEILEEPEAVIGSIPPAANGLIEVCQGQTVYFQNESQGATSYIWDFGDLNTSTQFEPNHTYQTPGTYTVSLIARNACYCSDTTFMEVNVLAAETPEITCVGTVCEGTSVTYVTNVSCGIYNWNITGGGVILDGGGTSDNFVTVEWNTGPEGQVSLAVSGCAGSVCNTPNIVPIPIISENAQIQGRDKVCEGSTEEYSIPDYQGTEITWSVIGSGNIVSGQGSERITINWFGNANMNNPQRVIVAFNNCYLDCGGKDTLEVDIVPSFYIKGDIEVCENTTTVYRTYNSITDLPINSNWQVFNAAGAVVWTDGPVQGTSVPWNLPSGNYRVHAEADNPNNFCNNDYDIFVEVVAAPPAPTSISGVDEICPGQTYSYSASGLPLHNFEWEFLGGSPNTFNGNPANVTWNASGPYEVFAYQIATTGLACKSDPATMTVAAIPAFQVTGNDVVCKEETGMYSAPAYDEVDYSWSITPADRGTVINGQGTANAEVLWHSAGAATVTLNLCSVAETFNVNVLPLPDPEVVHPDSLCAGETVMVNTTIAYATYEWLDENGAVISASPNPNLAPGYYELNVVDVNGCEGSTSFDIFKLPKPTVTLSVPLYAGICPGGPPITITASTTEDGYDFEWFVNGTPVGNNTPYFTTAFSGTFSVIVTDQNGCTNTSNTLIIENCEDAGGTCVGGVCTAGVCNNPSGCNQGGNISFEIQPSADCLTHNFINTSTNDIAGSWGWNFGDPSSGVDNISNLENPSHTFTSVGYYAILFVGQVPDLDNPGASCPDGQLQQDTILTIANFDYESACPGSPVTFTDISEKLPFASITGYAWDFGDPASGAMNASSDQHPEHIYATAGTYTVALTITEASGCAVTVSKDIEVFDPPTVNFSVPDQTCEKTALPFSAMASADAVEIEWDFGDPASGDANTSSKYDTHHEFDAPGVYVVAVTATNIFGCSTTYSENITVEPNTLGGNIAFSQPSPICEGENVTLTAPAGGIDYIWNTSEVVDNITVSVSGVYDVTLTDVEGCTYSPSEAIVDVLGEPNGIVKAVEYNEFGQPVAYYENNYTVCEGEDVYLIIQGSTDYTYTWSTSDGGDEISFTEERGNLLAVGTHNFTVTVTDHNGCTSEEGPFTVTVNPKPDVQIYSIPSGYLCENETANLLVNTPDPMNTYSWNTGESGTSISVVAGGVYFAQATNQFGCKSRSNEIVVNNAPDIDNIPAGCHVRCDPDTMCLPPMPLVASYQWYFNNVPMAAPIGTQAEPIFDQSGEYHVEMIDIYGCKSISEMVNLDLVPGYGDILGNVYFDVNQNGIIDGPDTLVSGIDIILSDGTINLDTTTSGSGAYLFNGVIANGYTVVLDTANLPPNWQAYYVNGSVDIIGCDVEEQFDWLLTDACLPETFNEIFSACTGDGITYDGVFVPAGEVDTITYTSVFGCDSSIIVTVDAIPLDTTELELNACTGSTVDYNGTPLDPGDQQDFTYQALNGCDSIVKVSVVELFNSIGNLQLIACPNSPIDYNGMPLFPGDQQDFFLVAANGCDSVLTVSVGAIPLDTSQQALNACPGATVPYQGVDLSPGDQQDFILTGSDGCDSIVQVSVGAWPTYTMPLALTACENSFIDYNGTQLFPGDQQDFVFATVNGCDSTVSVSVQTAPVDSTTVALQVCQGESIDYDGQPLFEGDQAVFIKTNQFGCDSVIEVSVSKYPEVTFDVLAGEICWNGTDGEIEVQNIQGVSAPYFVSLDGQNFQPNLIFDQLLPGGYTVYLQDDNDCIFEVPTNIPVVPPLAVETTDLTMQCGDLLELAPIVASTLPVTFQWNDGSTDPTLLVSTPGIYTFNVTNACESVERNVVVALQEEGLGGRIYMPNSFSPNNDGINDCYQGYVAPDLDVEYYVLKIFDRWGDMMFETNDTNGCWDGNFRGKKMNPAVYGWFMELHIRNCDGNLLQIFEEGGIHLVR